MVLRFLMGLVIYTVKFLRSKSQLYLLKSEYYYENKSPSRMIKHKYCMLYRIRVVVVNLHVFSFLTFVIIITRYADLYLVLRHKEINNKTAL